MSAKNLPTGIKHLAYGTPLNKNEPTPTKGHPARPKHLSGEAAEEWVRLCDELDAMGLLTTADRNVIALAATSWARWVKAETKIGELGEIVAAPKTKTPMGNPWLSVSNKAHEQHHKMLLELGLTPAARSRIKVDKSQPEADDDTDF